MPDTSNAPRRKVRCPKCTAVFSEPSKYPFECTICSCRLSAKGGSPLPTALSSLENKSTSGPENAVNRSEQSEEVCLSDNNATLHAVDPEVFEGNMGASLTHIHNEGQMLVAPDESHGVAETDYKEEMLVPDISVKSLHESKENIMRDSPLTANKPDVANNEVLEVEDSLVKVRSTSEVGDLRLMRTNRCELSFKYSLERAHLDESDISRRRPPLSKFSSIPDTEGSDAPLHAPLSVRISSRHEESSDHSENGRYSFSSETDSHDGSESDFGFPSPWANGAQSKEQCEPAPDLSEKKLSSAPHQLELWDTNDATNTRQFIAEKSSKVFKETDIKPALQGSDGSHALSLPLKENEPTWHEETSSFDLLSQLNNLVKMMRHAVTFNDNEQNPDEDVAAAMPSNQQGTTLMPSLQLQHDSHKGPSSHELQALDDHASGGMAHSRSKNGIISSVLQGPCADVNSSDWDERAVAISTYTEVHARDNTGSDHYILSDKDVELDLYSHHKIGEWQHEETDDSPYSARCHEISQNGVHELEPHGIKAHQNGFSDNAATGILLPECSPDNHYVLGHHRFGTSSSELYNYQAPAQTVMLPTPFQLHSMAPRAAQYSPNSCTLWSGHPYPCVQTHSSRHCVVCTSFSGSLTCNSGPCTKWSCPQPLQGLDPAFRSSQVTCTQRPTNLNQSHTFPIADARLQAYLSRFPPLPKERAAPYILCKGCGTVLHLPVKLPMTNGFVQKIRCSACGKVNKFSNNQYAKEGNGMPYLPLQEENSIAGIPASRTPHLFQYNSGNLPYLHNRRVIVSPSGHLESYCKNVSQDDAHVLRARSGAGLLNPQGRGNLTVCTTDLPVDGSINASSGLRTEGRVSGWSQNVEDRQQVMAVLPPHEIVDEKEEGLDFGAPRISDGESLDPSESRMRSPENLQIPCTFASVPEADPAKSDLSHEAKLQGRQLLELLNQESTRFRLNLYPRPPDEEVKLASWSPASDSHLPNFLKRKERRTSQSRKGKKYIAGLLRRSLKDVSKGGKELMI